MLFWCSAYQKIFQMKVRALNDICILCYALIVCKMNRLFGKFYKL